MASDVVPIMEVAAILEALQDAPQSYCMMDQSLFVEKLTTINMSMRVPRY